MANFEANYRFLFAKLVYTLPAFVYFKRIVKLDCHPLPRFQIHIQQGSIQVSGKFFFFLRYQRVISVN